MTNPFSIQYGHASKHELYKLGYLNASLFRQFQEDIPTNQSRYKLLVLQINKTSWTCVKGTIHNQIFVNNIAFILMYTLHQCLHRAPMSALFVQY